MNGEFVDTNILLYAHDEQSGNKRRIAMELILDLQQRRSGILSVQVLTEFYVVAVGKLKKPLSPAQAKEIVEDLAAWQTVSPAPGDILKAIDISNTYQINFWDAMIVQAASKSFASILWTEDLNHNQEYEGVLAKNPFIDPPAKEMGEK